MAKLVIDSASLDSLVINREIFIPNREIVITISKIGRSPAKSGDLEALNVLNEHVAVLPVKLDITQNSRPVRGSVTKQRLVILRCSANELKNSFVPRTIVQWNPVPDSTTSAASVNGFRSRLYKSCPKLSRAHTVAENWRLATNIKIKNSYDGFVCHDAV